jgi:hypothetical protein
MFDQKNALTLAFLIIQVLVYTNGEESPTKLDAADGHLMEKVYTQHSS